MQHSPNIGKVHLFEVSLPSLYTRDHFIEVVFEAQGKQGARETFMRQVNFDSLKFNQEGFFIFEFDTARLVLSLMIDNVEIRIPKTISIHDFDCDLQHRFKIFPDELADHLKISRQHSYLTELFFNSIPMEAESRKSLLRIILAKIFASECQIPAVNQWLDQFVRELGTSDLLRQSKIS